MKHALQVPSPWLCAATTHTSTSTAAILALKGFEVSPSCRSILRDMEDEILDQQNELDKYGMSELPGRSREIAMRVALIIALSEGSNSVRCKRLMWAKEYVFHYHLEMIEAFKENLGKTADEQIADAVFKIIKKGEMNPVTFWISIG